MGEFKYASGVDVAGAKQFVSTQNNGLENIGNQNSDINYGPWGSYVSSSPFSGFKTSLYEGGIIVPFVVKQPKMMASSSPSSSHIVKGYASVNDVAPTIYQLANITYPATFNGHPIHPLMGKSLVPLIEGKVDHVYADNEPLGEMFNQTAVRMGNWEAIHNTGNTSDAIYPNGTNVWMLYNLANDPGEEKNVAAQHMNILQKMIAAYAQYAKNVGVVIPRGAAYANAVAHGFPPISTCCPVSINLKQIPAIPGITSNVTASYQNQTKASAPRPQT
jgi:arylsulfatase